jgi:hypothetical protein
MMNHSQILKRSWNILWSYRVLWIFGIILALVSPRTENPNVNYSLDERDLVRMNLPREIQQALDELNSLFPREMTPEAFRTIIAVAVVVGVVILLVGIAFAALGYVSQTALIRMVDQYESSDEKVTWREGFRLGWSRRAWQLFLVRLIVFLPVFLGFLVLFGCAAAPVLMSALAGDTPTIPGIIATIGLAFLVIFLAIIVAVALSLVMETVYRVVVLQGTGAVEGLRQGWKLVRSNLQDVGLMWLILVGIRIGFIILLIPIVFLALFVGVILGGGIGVGVYILAQTFAGNVASLVSAMVVGFGAFILVLAVPLGFFGGLFETYRSTTWTLTYRAISQASILTELPQADQDEQAFPPS